MDNPKESAKQINSDIDAKGKYQESIESPLHDIKSKEEVIKDSTEKEE